MPLPEELCISWSILTLNFHACVLLNNILQRDYAVLLIKIFMDLESICHNIMLWEKVFLKAPSEENQFGTLWEMLCDPSLKFDVVHFKNLLSVRS